MEDKNNQFFYTCLEKQEALKREFASCLSREAKYEKIIELGRVLPPFAEEEKVPENLIKGCQSIVYLSSKLDDGKLKFSAFSLALISSGLAMLLIKIYDGETPETILKCPPLFLEELGIHASLTPGRSNGLSSLYLRMKQDALKFLVNIDQSAHKL
ncbi:MAG TPA: SufE family protein [Rhabdochlamydiaceae bacterium]|nr:SufE family protein [Rhabdochlamydiaceae bacterium]